MGPRTRRMGCGQPVCDSNEETGNVSESINANELLQILNRLPSVPWSSRIDPVAMTSEWVYASPRLAELYGLTDDELGSPRVVAGRAPARVGGL